MYTCRSLLHQGVFLLLAVLFDLNFLAGQSQEAGGAAQARDIPQIDMSMSTREAKQMISSALRREDDVAYCTGGPKYQDVHVTEQSISFTEHSKVSSIRFKDVPYFQAKRSFNCWTVRPSIVKILWAHKSDSEGFATAMNRMIWENSPELQAQRKVEQQEFKKSAAAWRAAGSPRALPEEAERHRILAEAAFNEKNFERAVEQYLAALQAFPTWPEGQFNVALLCGESGDYRCAVAHMANYLELVPDAPDGRAAYQKIVIWQDKLTSEEVEKEPSTETAPPVSPPKKAK